MSFNNSDTPVFARTQNARKSFPESRFQKSSLNLNSNVLKNGQGDLSSLKKDVEGETIEVRDDKLIKIKVELDGDESNLNRNLQKRPSFSSVTPFEGDSKLITIDDEENDSNSDGKEDDDDDEPVLEEVEVIDANENAKESEEEEEEKAFLESSEDDFELVVVDEDEDDDCDGGNRSSKESSPVKRLSPVKKISPKKLSNIKSPSPLKKKEEIEICNSSKDASRMLLLEGDELIAGLGLDASPKSSPEGPSEIQQTFSAENKTEETEMLRDTLDASEEKLHKDEEPDKASEIKPMPPLEKISETAIPVIEKLLSSEMPIIIEEIKSIKNTGESSLPNEDFSIKVDTDNSEVCQSRKTTITMEVSVSKDEDEIHDLPTSLFSENEEIVESMEMEENEKNVESMEIEENEKTNEKENNKMDVDDNFQEVQVPNQDQDIIVKESKTTISEEVTDNDKPEVEVTHLEEKKTSENMSEFVEEVEIVTSLADNITVNRDATENENLETVGSGKVGECVLMPIPDEKELKENDLIQDKKSESTVTHEGRKDEISPVVDNNASEELIKESIQSEVLELKSNTEICDIVSKQDIGGQIPVNKSSDDIVITSKKCESDKITEDIKQSPIAALTESITNTEVKKLENSSPNLTSTDVKTSVMEKCSVIKNNAIVLLQSVLKSTYVPSETQLKSDISSTKAEIKVTDMTQPDIQANTLISGVNVPVMHTTSISETQSSPKIVENIITTTETETTVSAAKSSFIMSQPKTFVPITSTNIVKTQPNETVVSLEENVSTEPYAKVVAVVEKNAESALKTDNSVEKNNVVENPSGIKTIVSGTTNSIIVTQPEIKTIVSTDKTNVPIIRNDLQTVVTTIKPNVSDVQPSVLVAGSNPDLKTFILKHALLSKPEMASGIPATSKIEVTLPTSVLRSDRDIPIQFQKYVVSTPFGQKEIINNLVAQNVKVSVATDSNIQANNVATNVKTLVTTASLAPQTIVDAVMQSSNKNASKVISSNKTQVQDSSNLLVNNAKSTKEPDTLTVTPIAEAKNLRPPNSPFFLFVKEFRKEFGSIKSVSPLTIQKLASERWHSMTKDQQAKFNEIYEKEKLIYEKAKVEYIKANLPPKSTISSEASPSTSGNRVVINSEKVQGKESSDAELDDSVVIIEDDDEPPVVRINKTNEPGGSEQEEISVINMLECQLEEEQPTVEWAQKLQSWQKTQVSAPDPITMNVEVIHKIQEGTAKLTFEEFFNVKVLSPTTRKSYSFFSPPHGSELMLSLKAEKFLSDPVNWLIEKNLANMSLKCLGCNSKNLQKIRTSVYADGYAWCCANQVTPGCKRTQPFKRPPFFEKYSYTLHSILASIYHWAFQSDYIHVQNDTNLLATQIVGLYQALQGVCAEFVNRYDLNSKKKKIVKPYDVIEASTFLFGRYLILCLYERNTKYVRLRIIPSDEENCKKLVQKIVEHFIDPNHIIVSDCTLLEKLKVRCLAFSLANPNITDEKDTGWHCLNVLKFIRRHIYPVFKRYVASSVQSDVWQGFLYELEWRQRHGLINEMAFWSMIYCIVPEKANDSKKPSSSNFNRNKLTEKRNLEMKNAVLSTLSSNAEASTSKDKPNNTKGDMLLEVIPEKTSAADTTSGEWVITKDVTTSGGTQVKNTSTTQSSIISTSSGSPGVISSVMFQPDGMNAVTVAALLSIRTWPLVGYLMHLVKASDQVISFDIDAWRRKLQMEGFFTHPLKWLVQQHIFPYGKEPLHIVCKRCGMYEISLDETDKGFVRCTGKDCVALQRLRRPTFFNKFSFRMREMLLMLFHWASQSAFDTISKDVNLNDYNVRYMFWGIQKHCSAILKQWPKLITDIKNHVIEVGIIQCGDFCILGALNTSTREIRLKVMHAPMLYKSSIFEPTLEEWLTKGSTVVTCHSPFYLTNHKVIYAPDSDKSSVNAKAINLYLKTIVNALFAQYSTAGIKPDIIQCFLDEILWRQKYGTTPDIAFRTILCQFASNSKLDYDKFLPQLIQSVITQNPGTSVPTTSKSTSSNNPTTDSDVIYVIPDVPPPPPLIDTQATPINSTRFNLPPPPLVYNPNPSLSSAHPSFNPNLSTVVHDSPSHPSNKSSSELVTILNNPQSQIEEEDEDNNTDEEEFHSETSRKCFPASQSAGSPQENSSNKLKRKKPSSSKIKKKAKLGKDFESDDESEDVDICGLSESEKSEIVSPQKVIPIENYFKIMQENNEVFDERSTHLLSFNKIDAELFRPVIEDCFALFKNPKKIKSKSPLEAVEYVPLDEYYFCEIISNITPTPESVVYQYRCPFNKCSTITMHGNVEAIDHTLKHVEEYRDCNSTKIYSCPFFVQRYISTPCCLWPFYSEAQLELHITNVHMKMNSLSCLICCIPFDSSAALNEHMKDWHVPCEMPFTCPACSYKSSVHREVLEHFQMAHKNDPHLICPYCLKMCSPTNKNEDVLFTSSYSKHLFKHQEAEENVKCPACCLLLFTYEDLCTHVLKSHRSYVNCKEAVPFRPRINPSIIVAKKLPEPAPPPNSPQTPYFINSKLAQFIRENPHLLQTKNTKTIQLPKLPSSDAISTNESSRNKMGTSQSQRALEQRMDKEISAYEVLPKKLKYSISTDDALPCMECGELIDEHHFFKELTCYCSFVTFCAKSFAVHTIKKHSLGRKTTKPPFSLKFAKFEEHCYCSCLFSSQDPDKLASHLKTCTGFININKTDFTVHDKEETRPVPQQSVPVTINQINLRPIHPGLIRIRNPTQFPIVSIAANNAVHSPQMQSSPPIENIPVEYMDTNYTYNNEQVGNIMPSNNFVMPEWPAVPAQYISPNVDVPSTSDSIVSYPPEIPRELYRYPPPYSITRPPVSVSVVPEVTAAALNPNTIIRMPPEYPSQVYMPPSGGRLRAGVITVRNGIPYIRPVDERNIVGGQLPYSISPQFAQRPGSNTSGVHTGIRPTILKGLLRDSTFAPRGQAIRQIIVPRAAIRPPAHTLNQLNKLVTNIRQQDNVRPN